MSALSLSSPGLPEAATYVTDDLFYEILYWARAQEGATLDLSAHWAALVDAAVIRDRVLPPNPPASTHASAWDTQRPAAGSQQSG
jgi:hypothetical protein